MKSWTATSLPLSGAKGHNDGARPDVGVPADQSGVWNGELEAGSPIRASLSDEPVCATPSPERRKKGAVFGGNKANRWFRMSNLSQKWPKNKANPFGPRQGLWVSASSSVIVGRHQLGPPVFNYSSTPTRFLTRRGPSFEPVSSSIGQLVSSSVKN